MLLLHHHMLPASFYIWPAYFVHFFPWLLRHLSHTYSAQLLLIVTLGRPSRISSVAILLYSLRFTNLLNFLFCPQVFALSCNLSSLSLRVVTLALVLQNVMPLSWKTVMGPKTVNHWRKRNQLTLRAVMKNQMILTSVWFQSLFHWYLPSDW